MVIGISGKKQSGKSTLANMLQHVLRGQSAQINFADALKEEVAKACGVTVKYIDQNKSHFRLILQGWGTDYRRQLCGNDYWVKQWLTRAVKATDDGAYHIIASDVRFENEADMIRQLGGKLIRIEQCKYDGDSHISEQEMDNYKQFDLVIRNDGTIQELEEQVKKIKL